MHCGWVPWFLTTCQLYNTYTAFISSIVNLCLLSGASNKLYIQGYSPVHLAAVNLSSQQLCEGVRSLKMAIPVCNFSHKLEGEDRLKKIVISFCG